MAYEISANANRRQTTSNVTEHPQVCAGSTLKMPYRDGTTHVMFELLDLLAGLAALVPSPGVNLTRYHGVFAPNHRLRALIVPSRRGRGGPGTAGQGQFEPQARLDELSKAPETGVRHRESTLR
jgi:hypothetical protein